MYVTHEQPSSKGTYWLGALFGAVVATLFILSTQRIFNNNGPMSYVNMPQDIVQAYNMGLKDAMKTNPPSMELEQVCLDLWANKQPVKD